MDSTYQKESLAKNPISIRFFESDVEMVKKIAIEQDRDFAYVVRDIVHKHLKPVEV